MSRFNTGEKIGLVVFGFVVLLMIGFVVWYYAGSETGMGSISDKWMETSVSNSCNKEKCSTTVTYHYYVQFQDGRVFAVFNSWDWKHMMSGNRIEYNARGRRVEKWFLQIYPTIFSFKEVDKG